MKHNFRRVAAVLLLSLGAAASAQQPFPHQMIKLVVPYGPGATTDLTARLVAQRISQDLKQPVVVDNRAGASGMIGSDFVAKAAPDGYTILLGTDGTHTGNPHLVKNHPFHPVRDVTPITLATRAVMVLVAHPAVPANDMAQLIRHAKAHPGQLNFASSGNGSPHHMAGMLLNQMAGIQLAHVAYKGGGQALNDVLGGQVQLAVTSLAPALPHIKSGKLKALGITERTRYASTPNIPAIAETLPGYEMPTWLAFFGPPGMPEPVVQTLNTAIVKALRAPDVAPKLEEGGLIVVGNSPAEFAAQLKADYEFRGKFIQQNHIALE